jgi:hypothetical protein
MFSLFKKPAEVVVPAAVTAVEPTVVDNAFFLKHARILGIFQYEETSKTYQDAYEAVLSFTSKDSYLAWVKAWKECYKFMTQDARTGGQYTRSARRAMMLIRKSGKVKSWAMKQARLAGN